MAVWQCVAVVAMCGMCGSGGHVRQWWPCVAVVAMCGSGACEAVVAMYGTDDSVCMAVQVCVE